MSSEFPMLEEKLHRILVDKGAVATCLTCFHFTTEEICKLAGQRPPAHVIVYGCNNWDDIPF